MILNKILLINSEKQNSNNCSLVDELNAKLEKSCKKINDLERKRYENDKTLVFTTLEKEKLSVSKFILFL